MEAETTARTTRTTTGSKSRKKLLKSRLVFAIIKIVLLKKMQLEFGFECLMLSAFRKKTFGKPSKMLPYLIGIRKEF